MSASECRFHAIAEVRHGASPQLCVAALVEHWRWPALRSQCCSLTPERRHRGGADNVLAGGRLIPSFGSRWRS